MKMERQLPVRPKQKISDFLPCSFDVLCFNWNTRKVENVKNGEITQMEVWSFTNGSANVNLAIKSGVRPIVNGRMQDKRIFGYEAMSYVLSSLNCKISPDECKELVKQAVDQRIKFAKLMRESDWTTSPDRYYGENKWILVSEITGLKDEMDRRLNAELAKYNLRLFTEGKPVG